jgi:tetratricopeptide (TPR) repeat protein
MKGGVGGLACLAAFFSGVVVGTCVSGSPGAPVSGEKHDLSITCPEDALDVLASGRLKEARTQSYQALSRDFGDAKAIRSLAYCAKADGDELEAMTLLRFWTELQPENVIAWREFAWALRRAGRDLEAIQAARKGLELAPGDDELIFLMGATGTSAGASDAGRRQLFTQDSPRGGRIAR